MSRTVYCAKLKKEAPGLSSPPFSGELGQQIFDHVSAEAWKEWSDDMMIKIINEFEPFELFKGAAGGSVT